MFDFLHASCNVCLLFTLYMPMQAMTEFFQPNWLEQAVIHTSKIALTHLLLTSISRQT